MINNLKMKKVSPHPLLFFNEISVLQNKKIKKNHETQKSFKIYCLSNLYRGNKVDIMKDENSSDKDEVECDELKDAYDALYEESLKI